ncbi:non-specific lipid transfer protein GPI-anchored 9-like [Telopea speciosissima]|uniref:non-specific lipid transfer protein GPI-anchored 9-like n=1 Tax=Telopea speciosissima TaxID=54955 RepID=UPI001CC58A6B|nr:non-specific lipid transfer protein GPI-anchored 9-like [Telopea speciosissima]
MIAGDTKCLCSIFNNTELLKKFEVTQEDLLKLPKGCGLSVDIALCNKGTDGNSTDTKNSVNGLSPFSGLGFIATFVALLSALI